MKPYYELHITFLTKDIEEDKKIVENEKWRFSVIDGDPVLGKGIKAYATKHYPGNMKKKDVILNLNNISRKFKELNINVVRDKIELVIYDTKTFSV